MHHFDWFIYGSLGWYQRAIQNKWFTEKTDRAFFKWIVKHFRERYSKLSDGVEKDDFISKANDIFIDFFLGKEYWRYDDENYKHGYYRHIPFWRKK